MNEQKYPNKLASGILSAIMQMDNPDQWNGVVVKHSALQTIKL